MCILVGKDKKIEVDMEIIKSDIIKKELIKDLKKGTENKLLIVSQGKDVGVEEYKKSIINRCEEFSIPYEDKVFSKEENHEDILAFLDSKKTTDGFILLQPLGENTDQDFLRSNIKNKDLDGYTYDSLGKMMNKNFSSMSQTARSVIAFLDFMEIDLSGKDVIIANSNNVIGKPLMMYLNAKKATVTLFNSKTENQEEKIKACDIFITAIGKPEFYDKKYFRDGQTIIDVGISYKDGKVTGDVDIESLRDLDVKIVTAKAGVGSITTLSLLDSLINK
jgi:methylenetetrahydrofolate dehydrogenase (NADP+)/methenyltetrahydrofolate cyclohydrolase